MFSFVVEFTKESLDKPHDVHWLAVHSFFQYSFPESFICVLQPYKSDQSQAKVFFSKKDQYLESVLSSTSQIEVNGHLATVVDCHEEPRCTATRARVLQFPSRYLGFETVAEELRTWFGATVRCLTAGLPGSTDPPFVSVAACNDEVLEAALVWLLRLQQAPPVAAAANEVRAEGRGPAVTTYAAATANARVEAPPAPATTAAATATVNKRPRRPLFPEALLTEAGLSSAAPDAQQQQQQQQQQRTPQLPATGPYQDSNERVFQLGSSCHLRVDLSDLTNLPGGGVDIVIVPTNLTLSLQFGLAKAIAALVREVDTDCRRHLNSLQGGAMSFGESYLCSRSGRGFHRILFVALPNDRRMERQLGSGDSFRRAMDDCLERLMSRLARLASSEGLRRVAMPTLGSNLPLWGGGAHEWAEALAGAIVRLAESGAVAGGGGSRLDLRVCCVARDSMQALADAVARRLPGGEAPAAVAGNLSWTPSSSLPSGSVASAPPDQMVSDDEPDDATEAMEVVGGAADDHPGSSVEASAVAADAPDLRRASVSDTCALCSEDFSAENPATPFHCDRSGCRLCRTCVARLNDPQLPTDGKCVLCFQRFKPAVGNQPPDGSMMERLDQRPLPGFNSRLGTVVVKYNFPSGSHEGVPYKGIARDAYFPNSEEGRAIVSRLRAAFAGRVVFQIGQSATTGQDTAITWNTLHHKTKVEGGPANHGYPDSEYLKRISDELSALGY